MFCLSHFKFGCASVVMWAQSSFSPANIANEKGQPCTPRKEMSASRRTPPGFCSFPCQLENVRVMGECSFLEEYQAVPCEHTFV